MIWDDLCMQGRERADRQLLDAGALVGHLVPAGSMFAFLAAHRGELFADEDFADFFPSGIVRSDWLAGFAGHDSETQNSGTSAVGGGEPRDAGRARAPGLYCG